jgi:hypothetical protein
MRLTITQVTCYFSPVFSSLLGENIQNLPVMYCLAGCDFQPIRRELLQSIPDFSTLLHLFLYIQKREKLLYATITALVLGELQNLFDERIQTLLQQVAFRSVVLEIEKRRSLLVFLKQDYTALSAHKRFPNNV